MPRMSIYLPDDLAERLKSDDGKTSQVVQEALRRYLGDDKTPSWAQLPDDAAALLADSSKGLIAEAREDYQAGYRSALKRLPDLGWSVLSSFAQNNFELVAWLASWKNGAQSHVVDGTVNDIAPWLWKIAEDVGRRVAPIDYEHLSFQRSVAFESGYGAALRAAYELIQRGADGDRGDTPSAP